MRCLWMPKQGEQGSSRINRFTENTKNTQPYPPSQGFLKSPSIFQISNYCPYIIVPSSRLNCMFNKTHHVTSTGLILPAKKSWDLSELEKETIALDPVLVEEILITATSGSRALICKGEISSLKKLPQWPWSPTKVTAGIYSNEKNTAQDKTPVPLSTV